MFPDLYADDDDDDDADADDNDDDEERRIEAAQHCTDVWVNTSKRRFGAHNEDWLNECADKCAILNVEIKGEGISESSLEAATRLMEQCGLTDDVIFADDAIQKKLASRNERFISYCVVGELPGLMFHMNEHFVFTINSMWPQHVNENGVPVAVLLRAVLLCETIDEIVEVMANEPFGCFYGININIASTKTTDMWSLEVYSEEVC